MVNRKKSKPRFRASWNGHLEFGLVSFGIQAVNARSREEGDIHFHQLHAECHRRIEYEKACPVHGEVDKDEIVLGYEYARGKYVEVAPDELDRLLTKRERALTIESFIESDQLDPIYYDGRMYYLLPSEAASAEPYRLLHDTLERMNLLAFGQIVFSGKDQIAVVRSRDKLLQMALLNYGNEIREPSELTLPASSHKPGTRELKLAESLVRAMVTDDFDISDYEDRYRKQLNQLLAAKRSGKEIEPPEEEEEPGVVNLMEALQRSLGQTGTRAHKRAGRNGKAKTKRAAS